MSDRILKRGFIVYVFLSIFEFLIVTDFTGSFLKLFGIILMFGWLFNNMKEKVKISKYIIYILIYFVIASISLIWAPDFYEGISDLMSFGNMIILTLIASNLRWNEKDIENLLLSMQLSSLIFAVIMISNLNLYHGVGIRYTMSLFGKEQDPNNIAGLLIPGFAISIYKIFRQKQIKLSILTLLLVAYSILMTGSRGGFLAAIGAILTLFITEVIFKHPTRGSKIKFKILFLFILIVLIFIYMVIPNLQFTLFNRIMNIESYNQDRGGGRLDLWSIGFKLFLDRPFLGIGIGGFYILTGQGMHNQYLITLVENGVIGLLFFILALWGILKLCLKKKINLASAILVGSYITILFLDSYQKKYFWNAILISAICIRQYDNNKNSKIKLVRLKESSDMQKLY